MPSYGIVFGGGGANLDLNKYTASGTDILEGKTAITYQSGDPVNPTTVIGSMPHRGTLARIVNAGEHINIPYGFYSAGSYVIGRSLAEQTVGNANEWEISNTKVAWVNGLRIVGRLPEMGSEQWGNVFQGFNDNAYYCIGNMPVGIYRHALGGHLPRLFVGANEVNNAMGNFAHKIVAGNRIGNVWGTGQNFRGERTVFNGATFDQDIVSGVAIANRILRIADTNTGGAPLNPLGTIILHQSEATYANKPRTGQSGIENANITIQGDNYLTSQGPRPMIYYGYRTSNITHVGNSYKIYDSVGFGTLNNKTADYYNRIREYTNVNRLFLPLAHSVNIRHLSRIDVDVDLKILTIVKERRHDGIPSDTRMYFVMTISLEPLHVREADPSFVKYNFGTGVNIRRAGSQLGTVTLASDIYVPGYHHYVWVQEFNAYEYSYTNNDNSVIPLRLSMDCNHINENCYIYISFAPVDVGAGGLWMCKSELYIKNIKFLIK